MIGEILESVHKAKGKNAKKEILEKHTHLPYLIDFLKMAFDPTKKWVYTKKPLPAYKVDEAPYGYAQTTLIQELRRMYLFEIKEPLNEKRRDELFIILMESLHPFECELVRCVVTGEKLPVSGLTIKLLQETFPNHFDVAPFKEEGI